MDYRYLRRRNQHVNYNRLTRKEKSRQKNFPSLSTMSKGLIASVGMDCQHREFI